MLLYFNVTENISTEMNHFYYGGGNEGNYNAKSTSPNELDKLIEVVDMETKHSSYTTD